MVRRPGDETRNIISWFYPRKSYRLEIFLFGFFLGGILGIFIMDMVYKGVL